MANTVYGPYGKTTWVDHVTLGSQNLMNNLETQASVALNGLNGDFWSSHVLSGVTPSIDGTLANQLDIASGTVYLRMTDNSIARCVVAATNFTTATPSTTYYLDLNPDGSWSWGTAHSGVANHFPIAQCTTDGSGNIATLTDNRGPSGHPNVPYVVSQTITTVTSTAQQFVASFTVSVTGLYVAYVHITYVNATPQKIIVKTNYGLPPSGGVANAYFTSMSSAAPGMILNGSQASTPGNNQPVACAPLTMYANAGEACNVIYQDPGGTPSSTVFVAIQRIA